MDLPDGQHETSFHWSPARLLIQTVLSKSRATDMNNIHDHAQDACLLMTVW